MPQLPTQLSQSEAQNRPRIAHPKSSLAEATSEKATIALIRKTLCPQSINAYGSGTPQPLQDLLPPLTSSNELDLQLYALIAIIIKEFIYVWYSKITPDHVFVDEVVQLIAHSTRALEERFRQLDVEQVVLDEIPRVIEAHIIAYRTAREGSHLVSLPTSAPQVYHTLNPHPALSPVPDPSIPQTSSEQRDNEIAYQQLLAQSVLAVLLPTEDLENSCLRTLVSDILADRILDNEVGGKICHGYFLWETVSKLISLVKRKEAIDSKSKKAESIHSNRLEKFGLLSAKEEPLDHDSPAKGQSHVAVWMWRILQATYLSYVAFRFVIRELSLVAPSVPSIASSGLFASSTSAASVERLDGTATSVRKLDSRRPILDYKFFGMTSQLVEISQRMPWLQALLSLFQHVALSGPGKIGETDNIIDRFLRQTIRKYVLTPAFIPTLLIAVRSSLFPMNTRPESVNSTSEPAKTSVKLGSSSTLSAATLLSPSSPDAPNFKEKSNDESGINPASKPSHTKTHPSGATPDEEYEDAGVAAGPEAAISANSSHAMTNHRSQAQDDVQVTNDHRQTEETEAHAAAAIKRQCAKDILSLIPRPIARVFFHISADDIATEAAVMTTLTNREIPGQPPADDNNGPEVRGRGGVQTEANPDDPDPDLELDPETSLLLRAIEHDILDTFANTYCNKHLIFSIIETVLVRLLPELSEQSVTELMEERSVAF